jgi:hypothetical protein
MAQFQMLGSGMKQAHLRQKASSCTTITALKAMKNFFLGTGFVLKITLMITLQFKSMQKA